MTGIYLDYASSSPPFPEVIETMKPFLSEEFGNPSSLHERGRKAKDAMEKARIQIAESIGAKQFEIVFTSGGTEANNHALVGSAFANMEKGKHIITSAIEHHSILETCSFLESIGFDITVLPVTSEGLVYPDEIKEAIRKDTILITIMAGNNEIGTVEPVEEIAAISSDHGVLFHTDAVQNAGHDFISVNKLNVDLLSASSHKFNGPKGVGFLYVKSGTAINPFLHGGSQELRLRAGTQNVAGIIGMAKALEISLLDLSEKRKYIQNLKEKFVKNLKENLDNVKINGHEEKSLPGIISVTIEDVDADAMVVELDNRGIACSSGAACTSTNYEPSHTLLAIGKTAHEARNTLRFSLSSSTTESELIKTADEVIRISRSLNVSN